MDGKDYTILVLVGVIVLTGFIWFPIIKAIVVEFVEETNWTRKLFRIK